MSAKRKAPAQQGRRSQSSDTNHPIQARIKTCGTPGAIRTHDLWYRKPTLYPAELRVLTS